MAEITIDTLPHWDDEPELYDTLFLGGERMPGLAKVDIDRETKVDEKEAKGKSKAKVTKQGRKSAQIDILIRVLKREDWQRLIELMPLLEPPEEKDVPDVADALDISHFAAKLRSVEAIIIKGIKGPRLTDDKIMELSLKAVEFSKPAAKKTGGLGGGSGSGGGLRFGFFTDQLGQPLPGTYVAIEGAPATINNPGKPDNGKPLLDPKGQQVYVCTQKAILSEVGLTEVGATFIGRFFAEDPLIKLKWEEFHPGPGEKNVTKTPDKSKGAPELSDFDQPDETPDPTETDAGP